MGGRVPESFEPHLGQLDIDAEDRARLRHAFRSVHPRHGVRSGAFNGTEEYLARSAPQHMETYARFRAQFPDYHQFSYIPLPLVFLFMARLATLSHPGMPVRKACHAMSRSAVDITRKHVVMKPVFAACHNDMGTFLEFIGSSMGLLTNFGEVHVDRMGTNHYRLHHQSWYDFYSDYLGSVGYIEGLFEVFGITGGEAFIEPYDAQTFDLVVRW